MLSLSRHVSRGGGFCFLFFGHGRGGLVGCVGVYLGGAAMERGQMYFVLSLLVIVPLYTVNSSVIRRAGCRQIE